MSGETLEITVGKDQHVVPAKPLNLICRSGKLLEKIEIKNAIPIDREVAGHHGRLVKKLHAKTEAWLLYCLGVESIENFSADRVREFDEPVVVLMGLIDMSLKMSAMGLSIHVKYPEAQLHPSVQLGLADLFIALSKGIYDAPRPR